MTSFRECYLYMRNMNAAHRTINMAAVYSTDNYPVTTTVAATIY
ncbi:hypothetical protein [Phytobacter ursingii]|uniref:Uncharacterized protein n=1 Tax=Phytobacter ursingii TaxID=1972431 RepID=A0AB35RWJ5_9ENTR|nr:MULTISPECIES: hypothetical protein [Enterobacteriaceae]MDV2863289.1 hypothetical protein [Phytobacter ursingii]